MNLAAPLFLLGLAALSLPWLLHRFGRERPDERAFASERFLEAVPPPASRRSTLRYRALFALRWLALIGLCLLFARPWIPWLADRAPARELHLAVLDTTYSMRSGDRFDRASDALRGALGELPDRDAVRLFTFDGQLRRIGDEDVSAAQAMQELAALQPGYARGDFGELMRALDATATRSDVPVSAIVATDAQQSALPRRRNDLFAPNVQRLLIVGEASDEPVSNTRIDAQAESDDGAVASVDVRLSSWGDTGTTTGTLRVEHDGEVLASEPIRLLADDVIERRLEQLALPPGRVDSLSVRFAAERDDALPHDDLQQVAMRQPRILRVALAGFGGPVPEATRAFLATALSIGEDEQQRRAARVELDVVAGSASRLPDDVDLVVVLAAHDDPAATQAVDDELQRGTDVLWLVSTRRAALGASAVNEASGVADSSAVSGEAVSFIDRSHPLALGDIDWFGVRRYAAQGLPDAASDRVLLATGTDRAWLIERATATTARLLLLDDPLDGDASNLPFEPAFVDVLTAIRGWFDQAGAIPTRLNAGDTLSLANSAQIIDPDGDPMFGMQERSEAMRASLRVPGVYRVLDDRGEHRLEVVTDARESALAPMSQADRQAWQARHEQSSSGQPSREGELDAERASMAPQAADPTDQRWLLAWLLPIVAALLLAESLFANRRLDVRRDGS